MNLVGQFVILFITALFLAGRQLKSSVAKARPYFEQKELFDAQMEQMSQRVEQLQRAVAKAKLAYAHALGNLEQVGRVFAKFGMEEIFVALNKDIH